MSVQTDSQPATPDKSQPKVRHGCLTAMLWFCLIGYATVAATAPWAIPAMREKSMPNFIIWVAWPLAALGAVKVVCVIAIFRWKRWGFYVFLLASVADMALNVYAGVDPMKGPMWLIVPVALYLALKLGKPKNGWEQLE